MANPPEQEPEPEPEAEEEEEAEDEDEDEDNEDDNGGKGRRKGGYVISPTTFRRIFSFLFSVCLPAK